jgi:hypothetical protein
LSHYDVLEVSPKASVEVIRAAYKSLMQRHHPDKHDNGAESNVQAALLAQAYAVLSDAQQRRTYDELLGQMQEPVRRNASGVARHATPVRATSVRDWYAPLLIVSILLAGVAILVLSGRKGPDSAAPPSRSGVAGVAPSGLSAAAEASSQAAADVLPSRTVAAFMTDLSIELTAPGPVPAEGLHVLHIPEFGLRLKVREIDRWLERIDTQRPQITQQLLTALSRAQYLELIKADGDLYLRNLMETALLAAIGLDQAKDAASVPVSPIAPLQVLLPLSYSVR